MLPLESPYVIAELAREHGGIREQARRRHQTAADPDAFFTEEAALAPDPVYMGLRSFVQTGPIGSLVAWVEQKLEAREERQFQAESRTPTARISPRPSPVVEDREDLAA